MTVRVLGVDPGLTRLGFGVVEETGGSLMAVASGTLRTSPDLPIPQRLRRLSEEVVAVILRWEPHAVAIERVFLKMNAKSAVPAIQAAGVTMAAAASAGAEVIEFSASEVKQSVVGSGGATKDQVRFMVERLLGSATNPDSSDAIDALAIAITYLNSRRLRALGVRA